MERVNSRLHHTAGTAPSAQVVSYQHGVVSALALDGIHRTGCLSTLVVNEGIRAQVCMGVMMCAIVWRSGMRERWKLMRDLPLYST